nr:MAG TPA: hypothetical protein [Caudoviricetes sp.]
MCGSHLCGGSRTCTCTIGVSLSFIAVGVVSPTHTLSFSFYTGLLFISVNLSIALCHMSDYPQPIYKYVSALASLIVPPYHHVRQLYLHRPSRQVNKVILQ